MSKENALLIFTALHQEMDIHLGLIENMHFFALASKANREDTLTWQQAMNGPNKAGYWEACKCKILTILKKEVWDVVL